MDGLIAVTDREWFQFLSRQVDLDEVNFWQPAGPRPPRRLSVGAPVIFKHHKEHGAAIGGFGFFASFSAAPVWLAWEAFGSKNGAPDFSTFCRTIDARRKRLGKSALPVEDHVIGCIMLSSPAFFRSDVAVRGPNDWRDPIVTGKYYDLTRGEGARIWRECNERAAILQGVADRRRFEFPAERLSDPSLTRKRLGQGIFRLAVTDAYGRACAVTSEHSLPALEAAHIQPFGEGGSHEVPNGLLLRSDIHRLFDRGYVGVTPDYRFVVSKRLKDDFANGKSYYPFDSREIHLPERVEEYPSRKWLEWHLDTRFRG